MKEIILDTNIIIRYFIKDDETQYLKAYQYIDGIEKGIYKGYISILVINEIIWVLENYYDLKRKDYISKLILLFALKNINILETEKEIIINILQHMLKKNLDFTDYYLLSLSSGNNIVTFDKEINKIIMSNSKGNE
ncbi:MAG: PIN domain-containing protein [bacterium]|nr:PIN domain-containing protein [bacterium]